MSNKSYDLFNANVPVGLRYIFISNGTANIIKVIDYSLVDVQSDVIKTDAIFNFGFGDLDLITGKVKDEVISGNGDGIKVFLTALSTIPAFFEKYPKEAIMVTGSDSKDDFHDRCFPICRKRCKESNHCKNKHQRINVYKMHLERKYDEYCKDYTFFGGIDDVIEPYVLQKDYKSVFVIKK